MAEQFNVDDAKKVIEEGIAQAQELMNDPGKVNELLEQLQQKVKEVPAGALEALSNIPLMAQMVKSYVTKEYGEVSPKVVASLVSAFIYFVIKKDIIDDGVPVLGLVDDVAVVALAMKINEGELAAYKAWREANQLPETIDLA